jgi:hypothetical protein
MWTIKLLEYTNDSDKGVLVAHWGCRVVDGDYSASAYGTCNFSPDPSDPSYIPYENLTENDVIVWVWGQVDKIQTEAALTAQIEEQKNPTTETGVPWAN